MKLTLSVFFSFGTTLNQEIKIPLVDLVFQRVHAAEMTLILSALVFAHLVSASLTQQFLGLKVRQLLKLRYGNQGGRWYFYYPSFITSAKILSPSDELISLPHVVYIFSVVMGMFVLPLICFGVLLKKTGFSLHWLASLVSWLVIILVIIRVLNRFPRRSQLTQLDTIFKGLEEKEDKVLHQTGIW